MSSHKHDDDSPAMRNYDGGPAFPVAMDTAPSAEGMSLRDWFAGQALGGMIAGDYSSISNMAHYAYVIADAMLKARGGG
jgi:hypothetical protein